MPKDFDVPDFAAACDIFVSDYHNALSAKFSTGTQIIRFLCGTFWNQEDEFFPEYPAFDNVPELVRYIGQFDLGSGETPASEESPQYLLSDIVDSLLNGRPLPYYTPAASDDTSPRTRVLFFTGRKLSQNLVRDFNALAAQAPEKEFWLAYNDFRNTDSAKYLAQLSPDCSSLPLKPDPEKGNRWKLASVLTSRMGLFSFYPLSHILDLGKEEYKKCMGETRFDEVVITSTDSIKTVATLLAAASKTSYTFDTFNPERYSTSRPYRHQIAFLCRMLKDTGSLELPAELTGLKLTHGSGNNKDKRML